MKDIPMFTTPYGVASLSLREVPYQKAAYICILSADQPEMLLEECVSFCRACGAEKVYAKGMVGEEMIRDCLPITDFLNIKKPLPKLCFLCALIPAGIKLLSRLYYDIFFWGMPQDASEWLLVATYYIGDIASFLIGYFVLLYLLQTLYADETKRRIEFES